MPLVGLIAVLIAIGVVYEALAGSSDFYNRRCKERFGVEPLAANAVAWWVVLMAAIYIGDMCRRWTAAIGHDGSNALLLMGLGAAGAIASLVFNLRRTNAVYGIAGTALKIACALPIFLFAYYTVIGWFLLVFMLRGRDDTLYRGRPRRPLPGEAHWSDWRWNDPRWNDPRWANLRWDDPRWGILPWHDPRWNDPTLKDPRSP